MAGYHTVAQGEYLSKIAADYGFHTHRAIWDHPQNSELKSKRKTPNVLLPGDRLYIPDREEKVESRSTDQRHRFQYLGETLKLKVKVKDVNGNPIANKPCDLEVEGATYHLVTDGDGMIQQEIANDAQSARLLLRTPDVPVDMILPIRIGHLDPLDERSGQCSRLNNLGYRAGDPEGDPEQFSSAVQEFQCDNNIRPVTGECDARTQAKLKEVHGS